MKINWFEPRFGEEELNEVRKVLENNYLNEGPKTRELEEKIKSYLKVDYVALTTNATAALFLAIKSESFLRKINDFEVIVPDLSMIATATAVNWAGGRPVLVDVNPDGTLDLEKLEEKVSEKTIAVIPVQILGRAVDMVGLKEFTKKHGLAIIEDAAGALGSKFGETYLGTIGDYGCFSLQSNKIITCGQGGIIVTNSPERFELIRRLRDFGRVSNKEFFHNFIGFNLKFNDLSAAVASSQFDRIEVRKELLTKQHSKYLSLLRDVKQIKFFKLSSSEVPLWVDIIVEKKKDLTEFLRNNEIFVRPCWPAIHQNIPFKSQGSDLDFKNSTFISENSIWLPNGPGISDQDIEMVCSKIKEFYLKND